MSTFDLRSRAKLAFVVERYGGDEAGEAGRRTRSLAAALADRGHDVTVLTSCSRVPGERSDDVAPGETSLDGVRVVRFRLSHSPVQRLARKAAQAAKLSPSLGRLWPGARFPVIQGYGAYLDHRGWMFDAVLFTDTWGAFLGDGAGRVRHAVFAPIPAEGCTNSLADGARTLRTMRAVALATPHERDLVALELRAPIPVSSFVLGACPEPVSAADRRSAASQLVDGPFLLCVAERGPSTDDLIEAFRTFRDAHARTPFEDDQGHPFEGRAIRLIFGGDHRHPHAPSDGVLSLGVLDDATRSRLVAGALAVVHADPSFRLPQSLLEAWAAGRPTIVRTRSAAVDAVFDRSGASYTFESPSTFAACAASLLSRRIPREAFGARARQHVGHVLSAAKVTAAFDEWLGALRGRSQRVQPGS